MFNPTFFFLFRIPGVRAGQGQQLAALSSPKASGRFLIVNIFFFFHYHFHNIVRQRKFRARRLLTLKKNFSSLP